MVISCVGGYIGYMQVGFMFLAAPLGFLPYFAIGYVLPFGAIMSKFTGVGVRTRCAAVCFVLTLIVLRVLVFPVRLPEGQFPYKFYGISFYPNLDFYLFWTWRLTTTALYTAASLVMLIFVIPREENPLTTWVGQNTIYAFMFNKIGICLYSLLLGALQDHAALPIGESYAAFTAIVVFQGLIAFLIVLLLTSWPWRWLFKVFVEPECVYNFMCSLGGETR
jgi:hypothetical protein